jgi:hypothetical protein
VLYELSCLRDPHRSLGIAKDTNIAIVALSISESLAIKVVFENLATKLKSSKYFEQNFPFDVTKKELRFPHNIWVAARATTNTGTLGLNVLGAILDEGNFFDRQQGKQAQEQWGNRDKARAIYDQLVRRWKSRFQRAGRLPGMMILISSKRTKDDFTARRIIEAKDDPEVFVRDYCLWSVRPEAFGKGYFPVLVGNAVTPSKILSSEEVPAVKAKLQDGMLIVDIPEEFRSDFEADLDGAIRDVAGVETVSISPFIQQRDKIIPCIDKNRKHPFLVQEWDQSKEGGVIWDRLAKRGPVRDGAEVFEAWQPLFYPGVTRHAHIDPSLNSDATGFCMGCVIGYKNVERRNYDTNELYTEPAPVVWIDFLLKVVPPIGGEIDHGMIRGLVYQFQSHGFPIGYISMDQFQSAASIQKFITKGIDAERVSVDKPMDAYDTLKSAIYDGRVLMYEYEPLLKELRSIQHDRIRNKVDHPKNGSKDIADSLAGVVYSLTTKYRGAPLGLMRGISQYGDPAVDEQRETVEPSEFLMPFLTG